jgi:hypothetical protein
MNATAFGRNNPFGAKLNAIFSSDIGHFDVIDMRDPLPEAYELVEDGHITADDFRDFTVAKRGAAVGHAEPQNYVGVSPILPLFAPRGAHIATNLALDCRQGSHPG